MRYIRTLSAILFFLLCSSIPFTYAATEQRTALVIGNGTYSSSPLKNPINDATDMAATLTRLGFSVTLKKNATRQEILEAIEEFGNNLKKGGVGLFYYAGHGVQVSGVNYLLPIGARINKEKDVQFEAVDAGRILAEMENANNGLNIVLLDACRDNPFGKTFRSATRGLAIVTNAPTGTFISYSTGAGQVARDGDGRNSPYTSALLKYMQEPGLPINDVFMNVRQKLRKETGQVPWELSSLEGKFFFRPGAASETTTTSASAAYEVERKKIEAEKERLRQFADLEEQRQSLKERLAAEREAKRQATAERKKGKKGTTVAMARPPEVKRKDCVENDGRFCKYGDGTVLDTKTNLMWAAEDNGSNINWVYAESYCQNFRGGGYTDWRMPTQNELAGLYDAAKTYKSDCGYDVHLAELIRLTCSWLWASETRGSEAANFRFNYGGRDWYHQSDASYYRALPVRSGK